MTAIITSNPLPDKYWTWTISSRIGDMLEKAELKYGERDQTFTLLGIELTEKSNPHIWYRGSNRKQIIIRIGQKCSDDLEYAIFQVSQEIIHCLSPTGSDYASILEEGLATHFGTEYYHSCGFSKWHITDSRYLSAMELVGQLLAIDSEVIKLARKTEPKLSNFSKELLKKVNSNIPDKLADQLVQKF